VRHHGFSRSSLYKVTSEQALRNLLIEDWVLSRYGMEKPHKDSHRYILTIPYQTDEELDRIIYEDILGEAHRIADVRNGFVEADVVSLDDPERAW
jgi:hypothetical protein